MTSHEITYIRPGQGPPAPTAAAPRREDSYRRVFNAMPSPLLLIDHGTLRIVAVNQAATRALGLADKELVAGTLADFVSPPDRVALRQLPDPAPVPGLLVARSSWDLQRRDGQPLRVEVAPGTVDFEGHPCALLFQPGESEPSAADVARTGASDPEFSFSALHDLKEPLHLVKGYLSLLRTRGTAALDAESREYLEYAYAGAQRMQTLVLDLLEFFRVDAKGIAPEPIDLNEALAGTLEGLRLQLKEADADVSSDPLPTVLADRVQLARVLQNLVSNAIKFHGPQPPRVHVGALPRPSEWELWVADNGIGIDPSDHERVLKPFQRLHSTDKYPGTGLGLSISKKIIELHGGRLWIEAQPGSGTSIHFTLPKKEA